MTYAIFPHSNGKDARLDRKTILSSIQYDDNGNSTDTGDYESDLMWGDVVNTSFGLGLTDWGDNGFARHLMPPNLHLPPPTQNFQKDQDLSYWNRQSWYGAFNAEGNFSFTDGSVVTREYSFPMISIQVGYRGGNLKQIFPIER